MNMRIRSVVAANGPINKSDRTLAIDAYLLLERLERRKFLVKGWCRAADGKLSSGAGLLSISSEALEDATDHCLSVWSLLYDTHPELKTDRVPRVDRDSSWFELASAGASIYEEFWEAGDDGARRLISLISSRLYDGEAKLAIESEEIHLPWNLLYATADSVQRVRIAELEDRSGFWGLGNSIHQRYEAVDRPRVPSQSSSTSIGLYRSPTIDQELEGENLPRLVEKLEARLLAMNLAVSDTIGDNNLLKVDLRQKKARDLWCIVCHARFETRRVSRDQAILSFGTEKRADVSASDVRSWAQRRVVGSPVILLNCCGGGSIAGQTQTNFAKSFLGAGASCVIGPLVDIPSPFAVDFAEGLITSFRRGRSTADALTAAIKSQVIDASNPLALLYSSYGSAQVLWEARPEEVVLTSKPSLPEEVGGAL